MNKYILLLCLILFITQTTSAAPPCQSYLKMFSPSLLTADLPDIPIPTLMYSGLATNNPGQKYECEHKTAPNDPYHYFLIGMKNTSINVNTFTGLCVPARCTKEQIETILINDFKFKNIQVYDYPAEPATDGLLLTSWIILGIWIGVLVISSLWASFKEPVEDELIKKDE